MKKIELINRMTADDLLSDAVLTEVFDEEDEIQKARLLLTLTDRARELGVKAKFETLVSAYKKVHREYEKQKQNRPATPQSLDNYTNFDGDYPTMYCGNWIANETGIRTFTMFGEKLACYHPILPVLRMINAETGKEKIKLAFKKGKNWKEIIIDKGIIASSNKIVSLADYGVSVTSETAKTLVTYLSDLENYNIDLVRVQTSTSKLGWNKEGFMPYMGDIVFDAETKFKDIFEAVSEVGAYDTWLGLVKKIRKKERIEPLIYLAGSFASILIDPLDALPFVLNVWGDTGKGKTVSLMLAASIWANPKEGLFMTDPRDTVTSLEARNDVLNHLPLIIDDLSKRADKYGVEEVTDLIYMLCGGKGKGRSDVNLGLRKTSTWRNITLTNIERPLATDQMRGGAMNRILDVEMEPGDIFDTEGELSGNAIVTTLLKNYGFAGEKFVRVIQETGLEKVKKLQTDFLAEVRKQAQSLGVEKEEKQLQPLSILLTADKLATDEIFQDGIYLDLDQCMAYLKNKGDVSEHERAYEYIVSEVSINISKFKPDMNGEYKGEVWGRFESGFVVLLNNAFNRICERGSFSAKAFLTWAARNGYISPDKSGKSTKPTRINGSLVRCVWLKLPEEIELERADFDPVLEQEVLPFK